LEQRVRHRPLHRVGEGRIACGDRCRRQRLDGRDRRASPCARRARPQDRAPREHGICGRAQYRDRRDGRAVRPSPDYNSDAQLARGYLDTLVAALESDPRAASATGKLVYDDAGARFIDSAGIALGRHALRPLDRGHRERDAGQFDRAEQIFGPSGAAALFRREALAPMTGPFDEDLFAYDADVDLAWRLSRLGWHHLYVPRAIAFHRRRTAASKPNEIAARAFANRYLVWLKNESATRLLTYGWLAGPWEAARLVRRAVREPTLLSGIPHAMRLVPAMLRKRRTKGRD
jgi:hypothetical protein